MSMVQVHQDNSEGFGWFTRERVLVLVLLVVSVLVFYLCYRLALPFLPALTWALTLALVARPLRDRLAAKVPNRNLAALAAVLIVAVTIIVPGLILVSQLLSDVKANVNWVQAQVDEGRWAEQLAQIPFVAEARDWIGNNVNLKQEAERMAGALASGLAPLIAGSAWALFQLVVTLYVLFYCFRDGGAALRSAKALVPRSSLEVEEVFRRVADTIHATIFGSVVVAMIQGFLGGMIFWWLGIPAPVFWGVVMAVLAVVPTLGAFVIWLPTAVFLLIEGRTGAGLFLIFWGLVVISMIDNLIYPMLVGGRLRLHTLPTFVAIVGGIALFGAAGLILGPVILAVTLALVDVWKQRTAGGRTAEEGVNGQPGSRPAERPPSPSLLVTASEK